VWLVASRRGRIPGPSWPPPHPAHQPPPRQPDPPAHALRLPRPRALTTTVTPGEPISVDRKGADPVPENARSRTARATSSRTRPTRAISGTADNGQGPRPDRSQGGPGSSHQDATRPEPEADKRHGPDPASAARRTAAASRAAASATSTTPTTRERGRRHGNPNP
jgi:hypothetical protein